ncbi:hypothetical protein ACFVYP_40520 [Kitasatospora sp. NPDC058201]|uniref:hypothetical protein n=1 Tax=unclassified Kitasatospora TaxID=2633591 RepID=UPI00365F6362
MRALAARQPADVHGTVLDLVADTIERATGHKAIPRRTGGAGWEFDRVDAPDPVLMENVRSPARPQGGRGVVHGAGLPQPNDNLGARFIAPDGPRDCRF